MSNYCHITHAGNPGDVLKHILLTQVLVFFKAQASSISYFDTHSGSGLYDLFSDSARMKKEYKNGVERIWKKHQLPDAVSDYVEIIQQLNSDNTLRYYLGSPLLAASILNSQSTMHLYDTNSTESEALYSHLSNRKNTIVKQCDGFRQLINELSSSHQQPVILIDPPYVDASDYQQVVKAVGEIYQQSPEAVCLVWYPLAERSQVEYLKQSFLSLKVPACMHYELDFSHDVNGMMGSGMGVFNADSQLHHLLSSLLSWLQQNFKA